MMSSKGKTQSVEELLKEALIPLEEQPYEVPENWVWVKFDSVIKTSSNRASTIKQKEYEEDGEIPVVDQGMQLIAGFTNNQENRYTGELPVIVFGDHTRCIKWVDFSFAQGADGTKLLKPLEHLYPKYYYYLLKTVNIPNKGYSRHFKYLRESILPVPPFNEQKRIAKKVEHLIRKIEEVEQLIEEAKETFEFRRAAIIKKLIDKAVSKVPSEVIKYKALSEMYKIFGGGTPSKSNKNYWDGTVNWFSAKDIKTIYLENSMDKITELGVENSAAKMANKGSIVIVTRSGILQHTLPVAKLMVDATVNQDLKVLSSENQLLNDFLLWYIQANEKYLLEEYSKSGTTVNSIEFDRFKTLKIPVLPDNLLYELLFNIQNAINKEDKVYQFLNEEIRLDLLRQSILSKAFRGELGTSDPNDEHAIELLKKVLQEQLK